MLISHPVGNQNSYNAAQAFAESDRLEAFHTSLDATKVGRYLPAAVARHIPGRKVPEAVTPYTVMHPFPEVFRLGAQRARLTSRLPRRVRRAISPEAVFTSFDKAVAAALTGDAGGVYVYENAALATLTRARELGIRSFYELPIGYWRAERDILTEECALEPGWAITMNPHGEESWQGSHKDEEMTSADHVIVPSRFVAATIADHAPATASAVDVTVIPYGASTSPAREATDLAEQDRPGRDQPKLRVLWAGQLTQRKGLAYFLRALSMLDPQQLDVTIVGRQVSSELPRELQAGLAEHRWIEHLPHADLVDLMGRCDVMVLPTLFEGQALVITEALGQGLPVITTTSSGCDHLVRDGETGWIVPLRSVEGIAKALQQAVSGDVDLAAMKRAAKQAASAWSWADYRAALNEATMASVA